MGYECTDIILAINLQWQAHGVKISCSQNAYITSPAKKLWHKLQASLLYSIIKLSFDDDLALVSESSM